MKKTLILSLLLVASISHSKEINLDCVELDLKWKVSFDTVTSKGMLNTQPADMRSSDSEYALFSRQPNMNTEFRINRETLNATIVRTFTGTLSNLKPSTGLGKCSIAPAKNNLI
jgi:hypothetical protein